jgi:Family of unknown function (DUF5808)
MKSKQRKPQKSAGDRYGLRNLARLIGFVLLIASIVRELRLPKEQRTWHGVLLGRVPYDLRPPSFARLKAAMWNPQDSHIVVPTAFGVGWTVNLAAVRTRLSGATAA